MSVFTSLFFQKNYNFFQPQDAIDKTGAVLCDFDGTVSLVDTTDILLQHFGKEGCEVLESNWLAGKIGSRACMSGQIALLDASKSELDACLANIPIDPGFKDFVFMAQQNGFSVHIVSDGLDYVIQRILLQNGLDFLPIYANRLLHNGDRQWQLEFPHANKNCKKGSGNCKCAHVALQHQSQIPVVYIGDGASDFCVSAQADIVLAKSKLITYCQQQAIPYFPIRNFTDAIQLWPEIRFEEKVICETLL